jgi:alpha-N-arabinofuranosidase
MRPQYYTDLYRRYEAFLKAPGHLRPKMIASGGTGADTTWTDVLSRDLKGRTNGISFHYYTLPTGDWKVKGAATGFDEGQWMATLAGTLKMEKFIEDHVAVLDRNDPDKKIGFDVDEWGTWYDVEPGTNPGFLYQQNTLRDAVVAALNLNIFQAHADRVRMTNIAQMVNVLQAMILTDKDKMLLTPTYYAFKMYVPFQGATSLPVRLSNNTSYSAGAGKSIPGISASAARAKDGKTYVALVNTNPREATDVVLDVTGQNVGTVRGEVLTADAMDARNSFEHKDAVKPAPYSATANGGKLTIRVPAKAVMVLAVEG